MIEGSGPGAGKSTLASGLALYFSTFIFTEFFGEADLFKRPEFIEAATTFGAKQGASAEDLLLGYRRLARHVRQTSGAVVFDWGCAAMAEDLPWAQSSHALSNHVSIVRSITIKLRPQILFVEVPVDLAIDRAVRERGNEWLQKYSLLAHSNWDEPVNRLRDYYLVNRKRSIDRSLQAYDLAGWKLTSISGEGTPDDVLSASIRALTT